MATSFEPSEKGGQVSNLRSNTYYMVKIGPVDPEIILLKSLFLKNILTQEAEHIARGACMPRGLN